MPVDEKSPYLHMPLPHEANTLDQDLTRLRAAFNNLDSHAQSSDAARAALENELESKSRELAARDEALRESLESAAADLVAHLAAENPHHLPLASRDAPGLAQVGQGLELDQGVISVRPATDSTPGLVQPDGFTCAVSDAGVLSVTGEELAFAGYLTEFRNFFEQSPPSGWAVRNGAMLENAARAYPGLWAALHEEKNAWKCKSLEEWLALSTAAGGRGGAPFFVLDEAAKAIKLPDTRGDYERGAGSGYLEAVGAWHGDAIRNITGNIWCLNASQSIGAGADGVFVITSGVAQGQGIWNTNGSYKAGFDTSRVVPTAAENRVRTFGMLPCVYIGGN